MFCVFSLLLNCEAAPQSITVWQNLTNHCTARAGSPCCWALIQEETVMVVNQHPNSVTQGQVGLSLFFPVYRSSQAGLDEMFMSVQSAYAVFVVEHLNQQWILPTFFIIPPSFLSTSFSLSAALPSLFFTGATSIWHCRCVLCVLSVFLWSPLHYTSVHFCPLSVLCLCWSVSQRCLLMFLLLKARKTENSSLAAFQTNSTYLAIMQNITADIEYLALCHNALIYSLFKQLSGILWSELSACSFTVVTTN